MRAVAITMPLIVAACFGVFAPLCAKRLPPRQATWLLTVGSAVAALSGLAVLSLLAFVLVGQLPGIASQGHWSAATLREHAPVGRAVEAAALLALLTAATAMLVAAIRRGAALLAAYRSCRSLPPAAGNLVVVTKVSDGAMAVPGRPGRIVVARSLLTALSATERRALLAHERAHLEHGHHWHLAVVHLASMANPLLTPLRSAAAQATERWADEEAAAEVGDRRAVAGALVRAALIAGPSRAAGPQLALAANAVPQRAAALLYGPPESRPVLLSLTAAMLLLGAVAAVVVGKETEHLFEFAGRAYRAAHGY